MSFKKSSEALNNQGIKAKNREFRKRFKFVQKNKERFYLVFLPEVQGYEPQAIAYHQNLGKLSIKNIHSNKETVLYLNSICHEGKGECHGCHEAEALKKAIPNYKSDGNFWKIDKTARIGHFAAVYEVFLKEDGGYEFQKKENLPKLIEYQYRGAKSDDWDNLVDLLSSIENDPINPESASVIRVMQKKVPSSRGNALKTSYVHEDTKKRVALPSDWKSTLLAHDKITNTHFNFSAEDLKKILEINAAMEAVRNDTSKGSVEKDNELSELTEMLKEVSNTDFVSLVDALHTKEEKEDGGSAGGHSSSTSNAYSAAIQASKAELAAPAYHQTAEKSLAQAAPAAPATQAPATAAPAAPAATQEATTQPAASSKPMSALERLRAARENRG